jgi:hypothetical protein
MYKMIIFAQNNNYEELENFYKMDLPCTTGDLRYIPLLVL